MFIISSFIREIKFRRVSMPPFRQNFRYKHPGEGTGMPQPARGE